MINLDLGGNGDGHLITTDVMSEAIQALDNPKQKVGESSRFCFNQVFILKQDLVLKCLETDPSNRPTARELLFHAALFEIPSLKLLAVHALADDIRK